MADWQKRTEASLSRTFNNLKAKRVSIFLERLELDETSQILDLGSEDGSYLAEYYPWPSSITLADLDEGPMSAGVERYGLKGFKKIPNEGEIPFEDGEFEAVWCNSVIEHVTVPRDQLADMDDEEFLFSANRHQEKFAREISRIAKHYFVQTPYIHFPIESHSFLPLIPYFNHQARYKFGEWTKSFWVKQWTADFLLYDQKRFRAHFSDADDILVERVVGVPKSLIAVR